MTIVREHTRRTKKGMSSVKEHFRYPIKSALQYNKFLVSECDKDLEYINKVIKSKNNRASIDRLERDYGNIEGIRERLIKDRRQVLGIND